MITNEERPVHKLSGAVSTVSMMKDRVSAWLDNLGLGIYREAFQHNAISWEILPELSEGDLEALGVLPGHRKVVDFLS